MGNDPHGIPARRPMGPPSPNPIKYNRIFARPPLRPRHKIRSRRPIRHICTTPSHFSRQSPTAIMAGVRNDTTPLGTNTTKACRSSRAHSSTQISNPIFQRTHHDRQRRQLQRHRRSFRVGDRTQKHDTRVMLRTDNRKPKHTPPLRVLRDTILGSLPPPLLRIPKHPHNNGKNPTIFRLKNRDLIHNHDPRGKPTLQTSATGFRHYCLTKPHVPRNHPPIPINVPSPTYKGPQKRLRYIPTSPPPS